MISKAIENAQRKVEGHNFDIRKHLLEYDDVMNKQREVIYGQRLEVLRGENIRLIIDDMISDLVDQVAHEFAQEKIPSEDWEWDGFREQVAELFNLKLQWDDDDRLDLNRKDLAAKLLAEVKKAYQLQVERNGDEQMRQLERIILLQMVDTHWNEHLLNMDHLKEGIGLRGYGQLNPLDEYKKEGFNLFLSMIGRVKEQTVGTLLRVQVVQDDEVARLEEEQRRREQEMQLKLNLGAAGGEPPERKPVRRKQEKIGRNAACPCGSGKKYKKCCGRLN
ncbi:MAG TPA: hypothetical protein ENG79_04670 [Desulfobacteraceae bacterium]|nr:hypothetical protein [Desulfobacteraceae bacterium]